MSEALRSELEEQHEVILAKKTSGEISLQEYVELRDKLYAVIGNPNWPTNRNRGQSVGKASDPDQHHELKVSQGMENNYQQLYQKEND
jgi:hypothetical protein